MVGVSGGSAWYWGLRSGSCHLSYLLDDAARSASIEAQTFAYKQLLDAVDLQSIDQMVTIVCWVGFSLYMFAIHRIS